MFNRAEVILMQQLLTLASAPLGSYGALGQQTQMLCVSASEDKPQSWPRFSTSHPSELCATNPRGTAIPSHGTITVSRVK